MTDLATVLARAMERCRDGYEKGESTGWRFRAIHDENCARDYHGCGCLCHLAQDILATPTMQALAAIVEAALIGESWEDLTGGTASGIRLDNAIDAYREATR